MKDLGLSIVLKNITVKNNLNKVYFGGVQIVSLDKYLSMAVNEYGWTIVIYSQEKNDITGRILRKFDTIISPGTNTLTTNESNNLLVIYLEYVNSLLNKNTYTLYAGISFIDTVSGDSGIIQYPFKEHMNQSIIFDELIKIITIKNPNDIIIYADKLPFKEKDLVDKLHITYYNYKIHFNKLPKQFTNKAYQDNLFNSIFNRLNNNQEVNSDNCDKNDNINLDDNSSPNILNNITRKLGIQDYYYCQIVLTIILEYVVKRNRSLLEKIKPPRLMIQDSNNLILANNSLEQLNIVNNIKKNYYFQKKNSLLELLDMTKTLIGKRLFRSRLMNPITNNQILNQRYNYIESYQYLDSNLKKQIIYNLKNITDIQNTSCKLKRSTLKYNDICLLF